MRITNEQLEYSTRQVIQEITGDCIEDVDEETLVAMIGEISGVLKLADRLKEVLNT